MSDIETSQERIICNGRLLSDENFDGEPLGRETQMARLRACLHPMLRGEEPMNASLYGPPGTGKTTVARWVMDDVCASGSQRIGVYVNCWQHRTLYSVLQGIIDELKVLVSEAQDTNFKFGRIKQAFRDKPAVIILDEIDRPMPSQREEIIYGLLNLPRTGLICIGNSTRALAMLDERVRSRLNPILIEFLEYSMSEIEKILADRARQALTPRTWAPDHLKSIASAAGGDARAAIQMLRRVAAAAEMKGGETLDTQLIDLYSPQHQAIQRWSRFEALSEHEKIIWELAAQRGPLGTTELRRRYGEYCRGRELQPIAKRTFSKYLSRLSSAGVLRISARPMTPGGRMVQVEQP
ncbi:MAG: orc1/cdc6 family replication initiation protein [bacterium]|nr:orc1/cdc6 family replication initiation protein [bacterium]